MRTAFIKRLSQAEMPRAFRLLQPVRCCVLATAPSIEVLAALSAVVLLVVVSVVLMQRIRLLHQANRQQRMINYFATSLYGQNTVEDIFWDIAKNCISKLKFEDCVIYQFDPTRKILVQKAAFGHKNPHKYEILNPIEIPLGKGIVGTVALSGRAEIITDTSGDERYILDDMQRFSEITVPIYVEGKLFGVIDSEHHRKNFFTKEHLHMLEQIALVCSAKISKYLVEEKLRGKIARDLHDEIGSTLTSINIISSLALQQSGADPDMQSQLGKIKEYSAKMMESMSDIIWAINPSNDSLEKIQIKMKELTAELLEPARINYYFHEEGNLHGVKLHLGQRKDLYLIFKEALNNSVKYSAASEVQVILRREDGSLQLKVIDNGRGFDQSTEHSGNGLKNMQSRAEQIGGTLKIVSLPGTGTTIALDVPLE